MAVEQSRSDLRSIKGNRFVRSRLELVSPPNSLLSLFVSWTDIPFERSANNFPTPPPPPRAEDGAKVKAFLDAWMRATFPRPDCCTRVSSAVSTSVVLEGNASSSAYVLVRHGMWSGCRACARGPPLAILPVFYCPVMH